MNKESIDVIGGKNRLTLSLQRKKRLNSKIVIVVKTEIGKDERKLLNKLNLNKTILVLDFSTVDYFNLDHNNTKV